LRLGIPVEFVAAGLVRRAHEREHPISASAQARPQLAPNEPARTRDRNG
jgi:hypothetical protein